MLRFPHFLQNWLTDGGKVVSPTHWLPFTPHEDFRYSFLLEAGSTLGTQWLEGLGKLKKSTSSGPVLPACSLVPRPTTLSCAPSYMEVIWDYWFGITETKHQGKNLNQRTFNRGSTVQDLYLITVQISIMAVITFWFISNTASIS
jgi:hypothetical protein